MNKSLLLGTAAALTLAASGAFAGGNTVLWNQNANFGQYLLSQTISGYEMAAADDFAVPSGQTWHVAEVDVTGVYFNGSGPSQSQTVTFYADREGKPGRIERGPFTIHCTENDGNFQCVLPTPARLRSGTWWVSVVANIDAGAEWGWVENTVVQGNEAVWRDPSQSGKCQRFKPLHICQGTPADMAFDLVGTAN